LRQTKTGIPFDRNLGRRIAFYLARHFYLANANANAKEKIMPVILLWAIPAVIVIGGGGYWLLHLH